MLLSFSKCSISALTAPTCIYMYLHVSVNRVNAIGENTNFSFQFRAEFHCVPSIIYRFVCIQYNVILSCDGAHLKSVSVIGVKKAVH